jgi:hypothetical protein
LKVLIVHHDLDAIRAVLVPFAARRDVQTREQTDCEDGQQEAAVGHGRRLSPEPCGDRSAVGSGAVEAVNILGKQQDPP